MNYLQDTGKIKKLIKSVILMTYCSFLLISATNKQLLKYYLINTTPLLIWD